MATIICFCVTFPFQTVNKTGAKKMIESVSRQYMNAKRSANECDGFTRGLVRGGTSVPLQGSPQETQQVRNALVLN